MNPLSVIEKYYSTDSNLYNILVTHSVLVANKALSIVDAHPELGADRTFVQEAALLHDLGIIKTDAAGICCHGTEPYMCHGYLGADMLRAEGFERHALVAERHTGTGLMPDYIKEKGMPLPEGRIYYPVSIEEQIICFADKFFSKTHLTTEKDIEKIELSMAKWSDSSVERFREWCRLFL